jgi:outer membrane protein OmpA-like peptidoglycan-associated protein
MITSNYQWGRVLLAGVLTAALAAGCASTPKKPAGSEDVRAKLTQLQADASLATLAPDALKEAEFAVRQAELPRKSAAIEAHHVYIADRKVDTARAFAETRRAEQERPALVAAGERARLDSRTREAELAKSEAQLAKSDAQVALTEAQQARAQAEQTRREAEDARAQATVAQNAASELQQQAAELQRELAMLQARPTDRGLVLTLGDTLFATGKAELKSGATANLDRLGNFLSEYPERTAVIEGFTDSMGSEEYNRELSQRRAESVKRYLVERGVESNRLSSAGRGESAPVADNESAAGRQQNRRVEVIISEANGPKQPK